LTRIDLTRERSNSGLKVNALGLGPGGHHKQEGLMNWFREEGKAESTSRRLGAGYLHGGPRERK